MDEEIKKPKREQKRRRIIDVETIAEEVKKKLKNELLIIRDESLGRTIELQSNQESLETLFNMAWNIQHNFFKKNDKPPVYVQ